MQFKPDAYTPDTVYYQVFPLIVLSPEWFNSQLWFVFCSPTFTDIWAGKSALWIAVTWATTIAKRMCLYKDQLRWNPRPKSLQKTNRKSIRIITKMIHPVSKKSRKWMPPLLRTMLISGRRFEHQVTAAISSRKIRSGVTSRPILKISSKSRALAVEKMKGQCHNVRQYHHARHLHPALQLRNVQQYAIQHHSQLHLRHLPLLSQPNPFPFLWERPNPLRGKFHRKTSKRKNRSLIPACPSRALSNN